MNIINDPKIKRLNRELMNVGSAIWKSAEIHVEPTEFLVTLHLKDETQESVKETYRFFSQVLSDKILYIKENVKSWSAALYYNGESIDFIHSNEFYQNCWESDFLKFPFYIEENLRVYISKTVDADLVIETDNNDFIFIRVLNILETSKKTLERLDKLIKETLSNHSFTKQLLVSYEQKNEVFRSFLIKK